MSRPGAVVFFGGLSVLARHGRVLTEARARGLACLLLSFGEPSTRDRLERRRREAGHPFAALAEVAYVPGADTGLVLRQLADWTATYRLRAVLSCGEVFVDPAGIAADLLGLPGPGLRAARVCRDKFLQRRYLAELSPASVLVRPEERAAAQDRGRWPAAEVVLKPTGRMSSSGVRMVRTVAGLRAGFAALRPDEPVLLEERVPGPEFSVETLVQDGTVVACGITGKRTNEGRTEYFAELAHVVPALLDPEQERALRTANAAVLSRLEVENGITHAEFRLCPGGRAVLMEVAARVPGDGITYLYDLATGGCLEPALLDIALGVPARYPPPRRRATHVYLEHPPGRLAAVHAAPAPTWIGATDRWPELPPLPADAAPCCRAVLVWRNPGDRLVPVAESDDRAASIMVDAPLAADIDDFAARVAGTVTIEVQPPGGTPPG